ncbi:helix-turn-helix transcriptional regulator [Patescibacteria group bacterium]|nr:helix-turn-helix transcriptional regulator [Patescibacteria group bacterium]
MSSSLSPRAAKKLGERIRQARQGKNLRQSDLGKLVGLSTQSISAFESGRIPPAREHIEKIAYHTGRPIHFFTGQKVAEALARVEQLQTELKELHEILSQIVEGE